MTMISFPNDTENIIDAIRGAIGRPVTFRYVDTYSGCNSCNLDPVTNTSTDSFCTTCSGLYWIPLWGNTTISGYIFWNSANELNWPTGGEYFSGDCRVQIKYNLNIWDLVERTKYVIVDGVTTTITNFSKRGVPDLNRIILYLDQEDKDE